VAQETSLLSWASSLSLFARDLPNILYLPFLFL
jgi:hypothetical protein